MLAVLLTISNLNAQNDIFKLAQIRDLVFIAIYKLTRALSNIDIATDHRRCICQTLTEYKRTIIQVKNTFH